MKRTSLLSLLVGVVSFLAVAPTAHTVEPLKAPDTIELAYLDSALVGEPIEAPDDAFSVPSAPSVSSMVQSPANNWHIETVDSEGVRGSTSLVLDSAGHPHISYSEFDGYSVGSLKYAWYDGVHWHIETVDSGEWLYAAPSLALDGTGHPHISYSEFDDYPVGSLKYAWHDGTDWHIETVDIVEHWGSSLALDRTGHPHISYVHHDYPISNLKYTWYDGEDWHVETIDSGEERDIGSASLALDSAGRPYISYADGNDLKYAWYDSANWYIETIDTIVVEGPMIGRIPGSVGAPSLALDGDTRPHISYISSIMNSFPPIYDIRLKYACYDGTSWHIETVDSEANVNGNPSLTLDGAGHPHISYLDFDDLKYVQHGGTSWHIETVDSGEDVGGDPSLALDEAGHPHISYYDQANSDLKYARQLFSLNKQVAPSDSLDNVNALTHTLTYSLTLSGNGEDFHLQDPLPETVHYVPGSLTSTLTPPAVYSPTLDAVTWQGTLFTETIQTVHFQVVLEITSTRFLTIPLSIVNTAWLTDTESHRSTTAIATVNVLPPPFSLNKRVSFDGSYLYNYDPLTYTLTLSGSGLNVRLWDPLPPAAHYVSGSLTSTLTPPAVYSPTARAITWEGTLPTDITGVIRFQATADVGDVTYEATPSVPIVNTAWLTATESSRDVTATASIDVMIPPSSVANWCIETVDSEGDVGLRTSLALDGAGLPHISYLDGYPNYDLKYAWYDGTIWHIETVDSEGDVGWSSSLALDGAGFPHISYYDSANGDLRYAWHDGTIWHIETVDSEGDVGRYASLALDEGGLSHISYFDYNNGDLKYAWHDGTSWHIETVDSEGSVGQYTSLALDGARHPHISYFDSYPSSNLKYAWHDGTSWHIETVDGWVVWGQSTSLALDGGGHPHISYSNYYSNHDSKYAWHDGTIWHIETVESEGAAYWTPSLALDEAGHPHISYWDGTNYDLKYVWRDDASWHIETVDSEGHVGGYPSLALDEAGLPHISYYDSTNSDLKYAWRLPFFSLDKQVTPSDSLDDVNALTHTLTYSLTLVGPGLDARLQDPLPDTVHYVSGSISSALTPPAVYSPTLDAVIWEGTLPTDTVQTIHFQVTPEITSTRFLSAPLTITNVAWMDDLAYDRRVLDRAVITIQPPPFTLRKQATPTDGLRNNDTLTYTLTLFGPDLSVRLWDPLPPSVRYVSGSITDTIGSISGTVALPATVYSPTAHAILWEGTLSTDTVEVIRFQVTPGISGTGSLSLPLPIVNTAWLTATESGRSVSATVIVNGYYLYLPLILRQSQ